MYSPKKFPDLPTIPVIVHLSMSYSKNGYIISLQSVTMLVEYLRKAVLSQCCPGFCFGW